jgi:hypothetical protein
LHLLRCLNPACGLEGVGAIHDPPVRAKTVEAKAATVRGRSWRFDVPLPPREVSQNARVHWSARARATREYRRTVADIVSAAARPAEPIERCSIRVTGWINYGARGGGVSRATDVPNLLGELKPAIDALQPERTDASGEHPGAGVIASDDRRVVTSITVTIREARTVDDEGVTITVTEEGASDG